MNFWKLKHLFYRYNTLATPRNEEAFMVDTDADIPSFA